MAAEVAAPQSPQSRAESFSPDRSPDLSPGQIDRASEVSHDDNFVPAKLKMDAIKLLRNQSLGDVANQFEERTFPKAFRIFSYFEERTFPKAFRIFSYFEERTFPKSKAFRILISSYLHLED